MTQIIPFNISKIQPHNIALSKESIDYIANNTNEDDLYFRPQPVIKIVKLDEQTYLCENGNHRLYYFAKKGVKKYEQTEIYDISIEEDRLSLAQYRREENKKRLLISSLSPSAQLFYDQINPPATASDIGKEKIENMKNIIKFVRSNGIYKPMDLEGKILPTKDEIEVDYQMRYRIFLDSSNNN